MDAGTKVKFREWAVPACFGLCLYVLLHIIERFSPPFALGIAVGGLLVGGMALIGKSDQPD